MIKNNAVGSGSAPVKSPESKSFFLMLFTILQQPTQKGSGVTLSGDLHFSNGNKHSTSSCYHRSSA
jgi:hypothetical protein